MNFFIFSYCSAVALEEASSRKHTSTASLYNMDGSNGSDFSKYGTTNRDIPAGRFTTVKKADFIERIRMEVGIYRYPDSYP